MTIVYKDTTFCVNDKCINKCQRYLTCEVEQAAKSYGLPLAVASFICEDKGEDGVYELKTEETDGKEMSEMSEDIA